MTSEYDCVQVNQGERQGPCLNITVMTYFPQSAYCERMMHDLTAEEKGVL